MSVLLCEHCIDRPRKDKCGNCKRDYCEHYHAGNCHHCAPGSYCVFCADNLVLCSRCKERSVCKDTCAENCHDCDLKDLCMKCAELGPSCWWYCPECLAKYPDSTEKRICDGCSPFKNCGACSRSFCKDYQGEECGFCPRSYCIHCVGNVVICSVCNEKVSCEACTEKCGDCGLEGVCDDCIYIGEFWQATCPDCKSKVPKDEH